MLTIQRIKNVAEEVSWGPNTGSFTIQPPVALRHLRSGKIYHVNVVYETGDHAGKIDLTEGFYKLPAESFEFPHE